MKTYLLGAPVKLPIQFVDTNGNPLDVIRATYRIIDQDSRELQASQEFNLESSELDVPGSVNSYQVADLNQITTENMASYTAFQLRVVEFELTLADGNITGISEVYAISPRDPLIAGLNSFQTLTQASLRSLMIPGLEAWMGVTDQERALAMIEARLRICTLQFEEVTVGQRYLDAGARLSDLSYLPPREFDRLSAQLKEALCRAQIAEAEVILGGSSLTELNRRDGLLSQTIGETHETYQKGRPLDMQVSKQALRYLSAFISYGKRIGRA